MGFKSNAMYYNNKDIFPNQRYLPYWECKFISGTKYEKEIKIINKSMKIDIDTLDTVIIELFWRIWTPIRKLFVCVNAKTQKCTKETIKKCGKLMKAEKFYSRV